MADNNLSIMGEFNNPQSSILTGGLALLGGFNDPQAQDIVVDVQAGEGFNDPNAIQELDDSSTTLLAEGESLLLSPVF